MGIKIAAAITYLWCLADEDRNRPSASRC